MQYMDQSVVNELWLEILQEVDRIKRVVEPNGRGSSRSSAMAHSDGRTLSAILDFLQPDGSHTAYHIMAVKKLPYASGPDIKMSYKKYYHNAEDYWDMQLEERSDAVVINHTHYRIGSQDAKGTRGFGGREFVIELDDGQIIRTTNLWYQGPIPPAYWDRLPNNAKFVE
jgi:hypothetical protein